MTTPFFSNKRELRAAKLAARAALPADEVTRASAAIGQTVQQLPVYAAASTICSYMAIGEEVRTAEIIRAALNAGKRVALPRTHFAERRLSLHLVTDLAHLVPGRYGILEPATNAPQLDPAEVTLFLIPGSVFDSRGNRLGYGAGFYDTLLAQSRGCRAALAYALQIADQVPTDPHDIPMDLIVTERGVIDCTRARRAGDHLRLKNISFWGHHGAYAEEQEQGIRLACDVDLRLDLQWPGLTDALEQTVNYPAIYQLIQRIQQEHSYTLLEGLTERIALAILHDFPMVHEVSLAMRKFNPPVGGILDAFEVEITRSRLA